MLTNGKKYPGMTAPENINDIVQIQPDEVLAVFACKMKQERLKQGISRERLAEITGVSKDTIRRYENATISCAHFDTVIFIAMALGISLDDLFLRKEGETTQKSAKEALAILMNYFENNEQ